MNFFIDIQGFQLNSNIFLCKEIAILNDVTGCFSHRFVKLPILLTQLNISSQTQADVNIRKNHGIKWVNNMDSLEYEQLSEFINNCVGKEGTIFVRGSEIKKWLKRVVTNHIVDLSNDDDEECPSFNDLKIFMKSNHCKGHLYNNLSCVVENVFYIWYWYKYCKQHHYNENIE